MERFVTDAVPMNPEDIHVPADHDIITQPTLAENTRDAPKASPEEGLKTTELPKTEDEIFKDMNKEMEDVKLVDPVRNKTPEQIVNDPEKELDDVTMVDPIPEPTNQSDQTNSDDPESIIISDIQNQLNSFSPAFEEANQDKPSTTNSEKPARQINNQIVINNPTGIVHLGPTVNLNVQNTYTQVNNTQDRVQDSAEKPNVNAKDIPSKDFMRPLWYSNRLVEEEDLMRLSKNVGKEWKAVGNGLKFNWAQLDQFEKDTRSVSEAVYRMLFRWLQWKDSKATVGRLTKVLFNHNEYDAIRCLNP